MKKTLSVLLALLFAFSLTALTLAWGPAAKGTAEKDGLRATSAISADISAHDHIDITVENVSSEYAKQISVSLSASDGTVYYGEEEAPVDIPIGEKHTFTFKSYRPVESTAGADSTGTSKKGCGSYAAGIAAAAAVLVGAACLIIPGKDKRRARRIICIMLAAAALPLATIPVGAADTVRSLTLTNEDGEFSFTATVTYHHDFKEKEVSRTTGMEKFEITYYWGPHGDEILNEEYIKAIADCGFTSIPIENNTFENNKAALVLLKKYGLTCSALWDARINNIVYSTNAVTQDEVDAVIKEVAADYREFDNLRGYYIMDEPAADKFERLGMVISALRRLDPDHVGMINLFPTYASAKQLGTTTYKKYLSEYISTVAPSYISYDHYHFRQSNTPRAGFFTNLENVRSAGIGAGLDQMQIILLTKHMSYADLTPTQIEWEVNMSLAYGMKRISYFTFWLDKSLTDQDWTNACMDYTGKKYQHYYDVQEINKWLLPLGNELFGKQSTAVFHLPSGENGCREYSSYGDLGEVEGRQAVIGFFDDGSFMLVNKRYDAGEKNRMSYTFSDLSEGLEYFDTDSASWKSIDGTKYAAKNEAGRYVITLDPGAGLLMRVSGK